MQIAEDKEIFSFETYTPKKIDETELWGAQIEVLLTKQILGFLNFSSELADFFFHFNLNIDSFDSNCTFVYIKFDH